MYKFIVSLISDFLFFRVKLFFYDSYFYIFAIVCAEKINFMYKKILITIVLVFTMTNLNAQYSNGLFGGFFADIGVTVGAVNFKSDFGERGNVQNYMQNNGYVVTGVFYLTLDTNYSSFTDYFKLRFEASYMNCNLEHFGKWVDPSNQGVFATQLRAMKGAVQSETLGVQLEYFPFGQDQFTGADGFIPYVSFGGQIINYSTKISSSLGPIGTPISTPIKYLNGGVKAESNGRVPTLSTSIGTRYKLTTFTSLVLDLRLQYYFSDEVDGMNPNKSLYPENQSNDWLTSVSIGYIYYLL